jgi:hypothetical protein
MVLTTSKAVIRLTAANDNSPSAMGLMVAHYLVIRAAYGTTLAGLAGLAHGPRTSGLRL